MATEASGLVHDAFVYSSDDEYLARALPFLEEGIDRGEPILAVRTERNARLLERLLGARSHAVDWAEDSEPRRTVERLGIFLGYIDRHLSGGASHIRLLGEPCWPQERRSRGARARSRRSAVLSCRSRLTAKNQRAAAPPSRCVEHLVDPSGFTLAPEEHRA